VKSTRKNAREAELQIKDGDTLGEKEDDQLKTKRLVKFMILEEVKFGLYQFNVKVVAAITGFTEVLEPGFVLRLPTKEGDILDSSDPAKEQAKMKVTNALASH
jgi:hypothetical protein